MKQQSATKRQPKTALQVQLEQDIRCTAQHFGMDNGMLLVEVSESARTGDIRLYAALGSRLSIRHVKFEELLYYTKREAHVRAVVIGLEEPAAMMSKQQTIDRREEAIGMRKIKLRRGFYDGMGNFVSRSLLWGCCS